LVSFFVFVRSCLVLGWWVVVVMVVVWERKGFFGSAQPPILIKHAFADMIIPFFLLEMPLASPRVVFVRSIWGKHARECGLLSLARRNISVRCLIVPNTLHRTLSSE
jgi:hypothetical protein